MLKLEIFAANQGDALLLHHGTDAAPLRMLIDGGAGNCWKDALRPRLEELGAGAASGLAGLAQALPLELIMVSHLDDDHINGVLKLLRQESDLADDQQPRTIRAAGLWVNVFDELTAAAAPSPASVAAAEAEISTGLDVVADPQSAAVIASIPQGRDVRDLAKKLTIPLNKPYADALVLAGVEPTRHTFGDIEVHVVAPSKKRLEDLRKKWNAYLEAKAKKEAAAIAKSAANLDESVFNLSSIVAVVRQKRAGKPDLTILLTGDARSDDILRGLRSAKLLTDGKLHVDVFKVPHHGSARNMTQGFLEKVTADHYVLCSDGTDDNPDDAMLKMLKAARKGASYHLWFSYRLDRLVTFVDDAHAEGEIFQATFRDAAKPSVVLDLA